MNLNNDYLFISNTYSKRQADLYNIMCVIMCTGKTHKHAYKIKKENKYVLIYLYVYICMCV